ALLAGVGARIEGWTWVAVWVVLVPFLLALERMRSLGAALSVGLVASVAFSVAVLGWFSGAITGDTGAPPLVAFAILALAGPLLEPQLVAVAVARTWVRRRGAGRGRTA